MNRHRVYITYITYKNEYIKMQDTYIYIYIYIYVCVCVYI